MSRLITKFQKRVFILAGLSCFLGEMTLVIGNNLVMMLIGSLVFGFGFGMMMPSIALFSGYAVRPEQRAFALSINSIGNGVGTFLSAYLFAALAALFGISWDRFPILLSAGGTLLIAVVFATDEVRKKLRSVKKHAA